MTQPLQTKKPKKEDAYTGIPEKWKVEIEEIPCDPNDFMPSEDEEARKKAE
jgi:hypothetical protein